MGVRGELFSTKVALKNRTYFFNVKENRLGDVFMTVVESKPNEGEGFDRHQIVLFADDMQEFLKGFDVSLRFIEKEVGTRSKAKRESRARPDARGPKGDFAHKGDFPGGDRSHEGPRDGARRGGKKILRRTEGAPKPASKKPFAKRPKVKSVKKPE